MADWWDDFTTKAGNMLIGPQTFGAMMPMPTDPDQRQALIANGLMTLGSAISEDAVTRRPVMASIGQGMRDLQRQDQERAQQQMQQMLWAGKMGEMQRRNQTLDALSRIKAAPGWSDEAWQAFVTTDPGEAFKVYAAGVREGQFQSGVGAPAWLPGGSTGGDGSGPPGSSPYEARVSGVESPDGRDNMKGSGATGYYQFMPATAHAYAQRTGWGNGMSRDQVVAAMKADPAKQQELMRLYTADSDATLKAGGMPVNDATRYALHWFGPGGGMSQLRADPNTPTAQWVGSVRWDGGTSPATVIAQNDLGEYPTVGALQAEIGRRMGGGITARTADVTAPNPQAPATPGPVQPVQYTQDFTSVDPSGGAIRIAPGATPAPQQQQAQPPAAPARSQPPQIDYRNDPVVQQAVRMRQTARTQQELDAADKLGAERVATLQREAQQRADRPERQQMREFEDGVYIVDFDTGVKRPTFSEQQQIKKGDRARNPQTGQEILWDGNQWLDVQTLKPPVAPQPMPTR